MPTNGSFGNVNIPEGFSEGELRRSYWWVTHREKVRKVAIGAFIGLDVILMAIGIWGFVDFLAFGGVREEQAARQLTSTFALGAAPEIREIGIGSPIVLAVAGGRYDLVMPVENPNPDAWVELTYRFDAGGAETPVRKGFILPGESKNLYELAYKIDGAPGSVQPVVLTRAFHRIDRHEIADYEAWAQPRLAFEAQEPKYLPPDPDATAQVSRTTFTLKNNTPYTYYDAAFHVLLYRADALVAVTKLSVALLRAGEARPQELFWYQSLPQVTRIEVVPDINIFDPKVYQAPGVN